jgi:hypothetical protein
VLKRTLFSGIFTLLLIYLSQLLAFRKAEWTGNIFSISYSFPSA